MLTQSNVGLMLAASVDDEQSERELSEIKAKTKEIFRRLNRNSATEASIESGQYTLQSVFLRSKTASRPADGSLQLYDQVRRLLPLHLRRVVSTQACLYLSRRPCY